MQFNNNAVILDSKIKKLIQNLVIHSNEKKNWWSKKISERKKFKNQNKKYRQNDGGLDTNKQTNTQKKLKIVNKLDKPIIHI